MGSATDKSFDSREGGWWSSASEPAGCQLFNGKPKATALTWVRSGCTTRFVRREGETKECWAEEYELVLNGAPGRGRSKGISAKEWFAAGMFGKSFESGGGGWWSSASEPPVRSEPRRMSVV